jgi:hypothetical protein
MKKTNQILFALTIGCLLFILPDAFADTYSPMIVRGGPDLTTSYADGVLTVTIHKAHVAAGNPENYGKLAVGSAAWVDRPLSTEEPFDLKQKIDEASAQAIIDWLRNGGDYWEFFCKNTGAGYFEVLRSKKAFRAQRID